MESSTTTTSSIPPSRSSSRASTPTTNAPPTTTTSPAVVSTPKTASIQVVCRVKPSPGYENRAGGQFVVDPKQGTIDVKMKLKPEAGVVNNNAQFHNFALNSVLPPNVSQQEVFDACVKDIADSALDGVSGCVMAYGQTGAGKTYTMSGPGTSYANRGIIPRSVSYIFAQAEAARQAEGDEKYAVRVSYVEIYNDKIIDLLAKSPDFTPVPASGSSSSGSSSSSTAVTTTSTTTTKKDVLVPISTAASGITTGHLQVVEDRRGRVTVPGLVCPAVRSEAEALHWLFAGDANRALAEHALNAASTRSHCVFTMYIEQQMTLDEATGVGAIRKPKKPIPGNAPMNNSNSKYTPKGIGTVSAPGGGQTPATEQDAPPPPPPQQQQQMLTVRSKLHLVDLAGSERLEKTASEGAIRKEAQAINASLAFLEHVVVALLEAGRDHVPYRQSKLTHLLKDALGGHCRTRMIAAVWPDVAHLDETVSTLRFATRMMRVRTTPIRDVSGNGGNGLSEAERERIVSMYEGEIGALRMELALHDALASYTGAAVRGHTGFRYGPVVPAEVDAIRAAVRVFVEEKSGGVDGRGTDGEETSAAVAPIFGTVRQLHAALFAMRDLVRESRQNYNGNHNNNKNYAVSSSGMRNSREVEDTNATLLDDIEKKENSDENASPQIHNENNTIDDNGGVSTTADDASTENENNMQRMQLQQQKEEEARRQSDIAATTAASWAKYNDEVAKASELETWRTVGRGAGLYADWGTAKTSLREHRATYNNGAAAVNLSKQAIDDAMNKLAKLKQQQVDAEEVGIIVAGSGNNIPTAPAAAEMDEAAAALNKAKAEYRSKFDSLRETRAEIDYLTKVADSLASRTVSDFAAHWASICGVQTNNNLAPVNNNNNNNLSLGVLAPLSSAANTSSYSSGTVAGLSSSSSASSSSSPHARAGPLASASPPRVGAGGGGGGGGGYVKDDAQGGGGPGSPEGKRAYEIGSARAAAAAAAAANAGQRKVPPSYGASTTNRSAGFGMGK